MLFLWAAGMMPAAHARTLQSLDDALREIAPGVEPERVTLFLDDRQVERAEELAGSQLPSAIYYAYDVSDGANRGTRVYLEKHRVRTLPEVLMVAVDDTGRVADVRVLSFHEPMEYLARDAWYEQFRGRALGHELALGRGIDGITGATLTARATTLAVRRILAVDQVIRE